MADRVDARARELQRQTSALMPTPADPREDIRNERARASCSSDELAYWLYDGQEEVEERRRLAEAIASDPAFDKSDRIFLERNERYARSIHMMREFPGLLRRVGVGSFDNVMYLKALVDELTPLDLHFSMFHMTVQGQGTKEQNRRWGRNAPGVIGTYAQTEMGHGTFLRGMETTATFDADSDEFVLHSPTLTSSKWWPGGLGKTANHCVCMARLFTRGEDRGVHAFIVPLRRLDNHQPLPGITVGDIGPKISWDQVDNGFLRMDHVRIPRDHMLCKYSQVGPDGAYSKPPNPKVSFGTMVGIRASIIQSASVNLAVATTIAVRYNAVRRQTWVAGSTTEEAQILDYQTQAYVLLPLVAVAYALHFTGLAMKEEFEAFEDARDSNDFSSLPAMHASSCGLKACSTWLVVDGIQEARATCGGHGFNRHSGIGPLATAYLPQRTYEGDNPVMCQQACRYLRKVVNGAVQVSAESPVSYLTAPVQSRAAADLVSSAAAQLAAFEHRAQRVMGEVPEGDPSPIEGVRASNAHCYVLMLRALVQGVEKLPRGSAERAVMDRVRALFACHTMEQQLGDFMEDGFVTCAQAGEVRRAVRALLAELRPEAVALVDGFDLPDYLLNSTLGRKDGDVYTAIWESAQAAPLNRSQVGPGYREVLQPMISGDSKVLPQSIESKL